MGHHPSSELAQAYARARDGSQGSQVQNEEVVKAQTESEGLDGADVAMQRLFEEMQEVSESVMEGMAARAPLPPARFACVEQQLAMMRVGPQQAVRLWAESVAAPGITQ
jgi:hypothetical protein